MQSFSSAGRLPEPKPESAHGPKIKIGDKTVVERFVGGKWIQKTLIWDGQEYVDAVPKCPDCGTHSLGSKLCSDCVAARRAECKEVG